MDGDGTEQARIKRVYASRDVADNRYSWFNDAHMLAAQQLERLVLIALKRNGMEPLAGKTILEIGCGTGERLREFIKWGAHPENVFGVDLLIDRLKKARALCPEQVNVWMAHAAALPFDDRVFDVSVQATVFSSILQRSIRERVASELLRVTKDEGIILWYDMCVDNPFNVDVVGIGRREICELFEGCRVRLRRVTLAPPLARTLAPRSRPPVEWLACIPWLCTHYFAVISKTECG